MKDIDLRQGEALEEMATIPDGTVNLVLTDPPYNIGKDKAWDNRKTPEYIEFMGKCFREFERVLKPNGQMYFFHNDMPTISMLMEWIRRNTDFVYNSFIVCNKENFRSLSWKNPKKENTLRSWFNTCEYILLYVKGDCIHSEWDTTGWERVKLDVNNFRSLRKYAYEMLCWICGEKPPSGKEVERKLGSRQAEHFFYCIPDRKKVLETIGGREDHFTRYGSTQWELCTEETYNALIERFGIDKWEGFREYESLRQEYESLRFTHHLDAEHNNVFSMKRGKERYYHPCQKPQDILERLIYTSTNQGDTVLDCFMGSGSTGVACVNLRRNFIGIEMDRRSFKIARERIEGAPGASPERSAHRMYKPERRGKQ